MDGWSKIERRHHSLPGDPQTYWFSLDIHLAFTSFMKHTLRLTRLNTEHNYRLNGRSREAFSLSGCPLIASWLCGWPWRGTDVRPSSRETKNADEFKGPSKPKTATTQASHDNHSSVNWGDAERLKSNRAKHANGIRQASRTTTFTQGRLRAATHIQHTRCNKAIIFNFQNFAHSSDHQEALDGDSVSLVGS